MTIREAQFFDRVPNRLKDIDDKLDNIVTCLEKLNDTLAAISNTMKIRY